MAIRAATIEEDAVAADLAEDEAAHVLLAALASARSAVGEAEGQHDQEGDDEQPRPADVGAFLEERLGELAADAAHRLPPLRECLGVVSRAR